VTTCLFVSDLHGQIQKYERLFKIIEKEHPQCVFLGGDLLPHQHMVRQSIDLTHRDFIRNYLSREFSGLRDKLGKNYPDVFIILGNDDVRLEEASVLTAESQGIWIYLHKRHIQYHNFNIYGYANIPPSPFLLKDWERYDVSRFVDPGCIPPEQGHFTVSISQEEIKYATIEQDLADLVEDRILDRSIFLFHAPPYQTTLDRAALDGMEVDHCPLDVHIGSIAIKQFIESRQPLITLHGHVHESARITGQWQDKIGRTYCFSAAHEGPELAVIRFDANEPEKAERLLIS
jgi:Icc-related predicted phosphoesterase